MHPSYVPNLLLQIAKWPVALASLASLFFLLPALSESPLAALTTEDTHWLAWGAGGYLVAWQLVFRRRFAGSYFSTFEHELTHALFAWATLHRVTGLTVTWQNGGECRFEGSGGGNWLISIAPYWFPTLAWPPLLLTYALDAQYHPALDVTLGVAIAYHITSTWRETHRHQPDLKKTSFTFAAMFLPAANILVYACILLVATRGPAAASALLSDLGARTWSGVSQLLAAGLG